MTSLICTFATIVPMILTTYYCNSVFCVVKAGAFILGPGYLAQCFSEGEHPQLVNTAPA